MIYVIDEFECYGCGKKTVGLPKRMKVEYKPKKQKFCKECYERLAKIKLGML